MPSRRITGRFPAGSLSLVLIWLGLASLLHAGGGPAHNPAEGVIPEKSLVRVFLQKEMEGILVRDRLIPQAKVVEEIESVGAVVGPHGVIVCYVGDNWATQTPGVYRVRVRAHDGKVYEAEPVGIDHRLSLVLLKSSLPPNLALEYSPAAPPKHFTLVAAGADSWKTASTCVRSSEEKDWLPVKKVSLTGLDASKFSWAGSLVLDLQGRLLGVLTRAHPHPFTRKYTVGYMLRGNVIQSSVDQLTERPGVLHAGWLGVYPVEDPFGIRIKEVITGSPAQRAGFRKGDVIAEMENRRVSTHELTTWIQWKGPETDTQFTVLRGAHRLVLPVRLGSRQERRVAYALDPNNRAAGAIPVYMTELPLWTNLGFELESVEGRWVPGYSTSRPGGVLVRQVRKDSLAYKAGFRTGDVLFSVNGSDIFSVFDLESLKPLFGKGKDDSPLEIRYLRGGKVVIVKLSP